MWLHSKNQKPNSKKTAGVFLVFGFWYLILSCPVQAATPCGELQSSTAQPPVRLPSNYTTQPLPAQGVGFTDTDFQTSAPCTYYRESNGTASTPAVSTFHSYKYSPFNCTDDLELVGTPAMYNFTVINVPSGSVYAASIPPADNNQQPMFAHCQSATQNIDKYTIYYLGGPYSGYGYTQIRKYRVDTKTDSLVHDFAADGYTRMVCFGCNTNGPHAGFAANGDDTIGILAEDGNGNYFSFVYDMRNARYWPGFNVINHGTTRPDSNQSLPSHRLLVAPAGTCSWNLYDAAGNFVHSLGNNYVATNSGSCAHNDVGLDSSGAEVAYYGGDPNGLCPSWAGTSNSGISKINVDTLQTICLIGVGWGSTHTSPTQDGQWLAVEQDDSMVPGPCADCLNFYYTANPSFNWQSYFTRPPGLSFTPDEILLVKTDGSGFYRMAHHRSRLEDNSTCTGGIPQPGINSSADYYAEPRAAISYSGKWISFDSNYGIEPAVVSNSGVYVENYVLDTGIGSTTPPPPSTSACDVNGDGLTNVADVQMEVNMALKVISCPPLNSCSVVGVQRVVNAVLGGACIAP